MAAVKVRPIKPIAVQTQLRAIMSSSDMRAGVLRAVAGIRDTTQTANDTFARRSVPVDTFVNNVPGALSSLTIPGQVTFVWRWGKPIVEEARRLVEQLAPVITGLYKQSFRLMINGEEVAWNAPIPEDDSEVLISNVQPYARKLEIRASDGILEAASVVLRQQYGAFVDVSFQYIDLAPPVWITKKGKKVPTPVIRIAPMKAGRTKRAVSHSRGRGKA